MFSEEKENELVRTIRRLQARDSLSHLERIMLNRSRFDLARSICRREGLAQTLDNVLLILGRDAHEVRRYVRLQNA